jgi:hypothetical protein
MAVATERRLGDPMNRGCPFGAARGAAASYEGWASMLWLGRSLTVAP